MEGNEVSILFAVWRECRLVMKNLVKAHNPSFYPCVYIAFSGAGFHFLCGCEMSALVLWASDGGVVVRLWMWIIRRV